MATLPTPEENAREILSIFVVQFKSRPNDVLRINSFIREWFKDGRKDEDFNSGMQYAAQQKWVEILSNGASFRLTELGFTEAPEVNSTGISQIDKKVPAPTKKAKSSWPTIFETAFDSYEVTGDRLGEGGAGLVFPVKNGNKEMFALKCLSPDRITTERRKRFKNEINFCSKYEHRNIIQIIDFGLSVIKDEKCPFYVMPVFPATLRKLMDKRYYVATAQSLYKQ